MAQKLSYRVIAIERATGKRKEFFRVARNDKELLDDLEPLYHVEKFRVDGPGFAANSLKQAAIFIAIAGAIGFLILLFFQFII